MLGVRLVDVTAGVTQKEVRTEFLPFPSAMLALTFFAKTIQPLLSFVDREIEFCVCVCVCFLPIHSGHHVRWTYQPGSHRRKVRHNFSSTFFLCWCVP